MINTPILFLVFNRYDTTIRVFEKIKEIKPKKLYIAADGPRKHIEGEADKCNKVRGIAKMVDWDCEVKTLFQTENLSCGPAVSTAINWFFDNEEQGIILEDDCLPNTSFFSFCEEMLERYKHNDAIMHIGGTNFQEGTKYGAADYYFSSIAHVWGWASWRRAWKKYDFKIRDVFEFIRSDSLAYYSYNLDERIYWYEKMRDTYYGKVNTWDYQWNYCVWKNKGLSIIPQVNLISNIGFGEDATHTHGNSKWANMPTQTLLNIKHPTDITCNVMADSYTFQNHHNHSTKKSFANRVINKLKRTFSV